MLDRLVDLLISWIKLLFFSVVLHADQRGIVLRFGKFHRDIGPGFHWKYPLDIDEVYYREVTPTVITIGPQSLTTKDDITVVVSVIVTYQIEDVKKTLIEAQGIRQMLEDSTYGVVSDFIMKHTWSDLRNLDLDNEISKGARRRAKQYGLHVINVQFCDLTKSRSLRLIGLVQDTHFV